MVDIGIGDQVVVINDEHDRADDCRHLVHHGSDDGIKSVADSGGHSVGESRDRFA